MNGCFVQLCAFVCVCERVRTMCVQSAEWVNVVFVLADTPAFLTFLHILHPHSCIAEQNPAGQELLCKRRKFNVYHP